MSDKLYTILSFTGVAVGGTQTLSHGLVLNGDALKPDYVVLSPQSAGSFEVVATTTTAITVRNVSSVGGNCLAWCSFIHPVARSFGTPPGDGNISQHLTPQPFVVSLPTPSEISPNTYNVLNFGAVGDGIANDGPAIQSAIDAAAEAVPSGAFGANVYFPPKGNYRTEQQLILKGGVGLYSDSMPSAEIIAADGLVADSLIRTEFQDGTQEFAYLWRIGFNGNRAGGAVLDSVVDFSGLFVDSYIMDVLIQEGSGVGLRLAAAGTPGGMGPVVIQNVWSIRNTGHPILVDDDASNTGAVNGIIFNTVTVEHSGTGSSGIYLKGRNRLLGVQMFNIHIENGGVETDRVGITIDGASFVIIDNVQLLQGAPGNLAAGIRITNDFRNVGIMIRNVTNANLADPVLEDLLHNVTFGAVNIRVYNTPDVVFPGLPVEPAPGTLTSLVIKDSAGTARQWFDDKGRLTGNGQFGAGVELRADATNARPLLMVPNNLGRAIGFSFPDDSSIRFQNFTAPASYMQFENDGDAVLYGAVTFLKSLIGSREVLQTIGATPGDLSPSGISDAFGLLLTPTEASAPTGIAAPTLGRLMMVYNDSATFTVTFANDAGGTATNGVIGKGGAGMTLTPKTSSWVWYSPSKTRWLQISL